MDKQKITLVVAKDNNNAIGVDNQIPWHLPEDLKFFKEYTMGKVIVMGRKTWESLPKKPLPSRRNVVISRNKDYEAVGADLFSSLEEALDACRADPEICIIGGADIYQQSMALATDLMVTQVDLEVAHADRFFPTFSEQEWQLIMSETEVSNQGIVFSWQYYRHKDR